mgnify:CR=1 FL=1
MEIIECNLEINETVIKKNDAEISKILPYERSDPDMKRFITKFQKINTDNTK